MKTLRELRKEAGVSQETLAHLLATIRGGGAYQGPISNIERGEVSPTVKRLSDILEVLGFELRIEARKGKERVILDLASLLGKSTRAKDTREANHPQELKTLETPTQDPPVNHDPEPSNESLEAALLLALKL